MRGVRASLTPTPRRRRRRRDVRADGTFAPKVSTPQSLPERDESSERLAAREDESFAPVARALEPGQTVGARVVAGLDERPAATEACRDGGGGARAAEEVEHPVARLREGLDHAGE